MTDHTDIVERLNGFQSAAAQSWAHEAAAEITRLRAEAAELRSVMIAAAEEIQAHWPAHCDAEGYGPANLMRRLEDGIPSQYAYTAGDFERLRAEAEVLRKALESIASMTYDSWSNGAIAGEIARYALDATKGTT